MDYEAKLNQLEIVDFSDEGNLVIVKFNNRKYKVRYKIVEDSFFGWRVKITSCSKTLIEGVGLDIIEGRISLFEAQLRFA